ncbi:histidine phosphatase family protein [Pseudonocardia asaccharolytica]|uniref:Alpha-ribazole phosphatase n=1 Tax=Pseudonocardia asaccharolytica DSM 44247 = NBRC 16224 TaxID=1123024 RepID=A0A511CX49_9PSEU|nr:histidine phosphatase family protein [Pseudonocardia asaccharolytica]GEL17136.1 alpha-ribazole phosphatase [Pseudonocardia asaccharolytica DSM 44247 = NBRC 16224]
MRALPKGRRHAPTTLYLVRHGESTWNAAGLLQGRTAIVPLTERGRAQAARAAAALADRPIGAVWSSDLLRARQTAALVAAAHGLPVRTVPALREQGHGVWEGRPAAGRAERLAAAGPDWAPPGGESARALHTRVRMFLTRALREPPTGELVLVTHGETMRAALAALLGAPAEAMPRALPGNGAVLGARRDGPGGRWRLLADVASAPRT